MTILPRLCGFLLLGLSLVASPQTALALSEADAAALVAAEDRTAEDRERDARRHPAELLVFSQVGAGMKVADLGAGNGYTSELLARAVGPEGTVYAQNSPYVIEKYVKESWPARLSRGAMKGVIRVDRERGDPLPAEATGLDLITMIYVYHDTLFTPVDRPAMNAKLLGALRPGGSLIVVDHHAKPGAGPEIAETLHRMDAALLRRELEAAGFEFAAEADFLRHPEDPKEKPFFEMETPTDGFVHRYVKPAPATD
ncbi:MAG: class I SAM-dependent methyltransferase [Deltaproteobacteria bacterium]|nr:class I SAM-dependent methyltransferase [Deltaproteobacteria bacterium]